MSWETKENKKEKKYKQNVESINNSLMNEYLKQATKRIKVCEEKLNESLEIIGEIGETMMIQNELMQNSSGGSEIETTLEIDAKIARRMEEFEAEFERKIKNQKSKSSNMVAIVVAIMFIMLILFLFK